MPTATLTTTDKKAYYRRYYDERKAKGLCVRCGKPAGEGYALCEWHRTQVTVNGVRYYKRVENPRQGRYVSTEKPRALTDVNDLANNERWKDPRKALNLALVLPKVCPHCAAITCSTHIEGYPAVRCMNCGWYTDHLMMDNQRRVIEEGTADGTGVRPQRNTAGYCR